VDSVENDRLIDHADYVDHGNELTTVYLNQYQYQYPFAIGSLFDQFQLQTTLLPAHCIYSPSA